MESYDDKDISNHANPSRLDSGTRRQKVWKSGGASSN